VKCRRTSRRHERRDLVAARWDDQAILHRFERAFDDYMDDGIRFRGETGYVRYRASVKARARELLPSVDIRPGLDYALTEVVRCKSGSQAGVREAVEECGTDQLLTFLPHPNARGVPKSLEKNIEPAQLRRLQARLSEDGRQA
jgi:hypothetical protein